MTVIDCLLCKNVYPTTDVAMEIRVKANLTKCLTLCEVLPILILVSQLGLDELAVQTGDIGDAFVLRANGLAGTGIGAVTKA